MCGVPFRIPCLNDWTPVSWPAERADFAAAVTLGPRFLLSCAHAFQPLKPQSPHTMRSPHTTPAWTIRPEDVADYELEKDNTSSFS